MTWTSEQPPPPLTLPQGARLRVLWRGTLLLMLIFGGLVIKLLLRVIERPVFGLRRPVSPYVTQAVCRAVLRVLGLRLRIAGTVMETRGALVANHASWLDIFVLNAAARVFFVSKAEVADWPVIGWLARATGTVFIRRHKRDAARQKLIFEARLRAGHRLLFFPEGTSSDSLQVLPFKSTLFAAFFTPELQDFLHIQPVSIRYHAPFGYDPRFFGWWGDMEFAPHLLRVMAEKAPGEVALVFHPPIKVSDCADRKALAQACEARVRDGFATATPLSVAGP